MRLVAWRSQHRARAAAGGVDQQGTYAKVPLSFTRRGPLLLSDGLLADPAAGLEMVLPVRIMRYGVELCRP